MKVELTFIALTVLVAEITAAALGKRVLEKRDGKRLRGQRFHNAKVDDNNPVHRRAQTPDTDVCFEDQTYIGTVDTDALKEASGIVAGRSEQDILWVHNDYGKRDNLLYALDTSNNATILQQYEMILDREGVVSNDFEDIAMGRKPSSSSKEDNTPYIYVGDIGDNKASYPHLARAAREYLTIYRFEEPRKIRDVFAFLSSRSGSEEEKAPTTLVGDDSGDEIADLNEHTSSESSTPSPQPTLSWSSNDLALSQSGQNEVPNQGSNGNDGLRSPPRSAPLFFLYGESLALTYPESAKFNAETLLYDPYDDHLYIITKEDGFIFKTPQPWGDGSQGPWELELVGTVKTNANYYPNVITGGDISIDGSEILIKTYVETLYYKREKGASLAETLSGPGTNLPYTQELQGEAICFAEPGNSYGDGYYTLSELGRWGKDQSLYWYDRC